MGAKTSSQLRKEVNEAHDWLNSDPEVPHGTWYKKFPKFTLAGEGEVPKTFAYIGDGSSWHGDQVRVRS